MTQWRVWRGFTGALLGAAAIAVLLYLPNLWWNWSHGFVSYLHVRDNAELSMSHVAGVTAMRRASHLRPVGLGRRPRTASTSRR